jgi:hypothetical protein
LTSPTPSSPPLSPSILDKSYPTNAAFEKFFSFETFTAPVEPGIEGVQGNGEEGGDAHAEQEFEFRLFRAPVAKGKKSDEFGDSSGKGEGQQQDKANDGTGKATKIRIRSPTPAGEGGEGGDGRFVVPFRGWGFYFSDPGRMVGDGYVPGRGDDEMTAKKGEYLDAAVGGEQILELKGMPWVCCIFLICSSLPLEVTLYVSRFLLFLIRELLDLLLISLEKQQPGCHLPWRVTHIKATPTGKNEKAKQKPTAASKKTLLKDKDIASCLKRKNLGKKRRIILRKALAAQQDAKEADQEKRTRRNREKKVKRRQREREKKAAGAGTDEAGSANLGMDAPMGGVGSDSGSE